MEAQLEQLRNKLDEKLNQQHKQHNDQWIQEKQAIEEEFRQKERAA